MPDTDKALSEAASKWAASHPLPEGVDPLLISAVKDAFHAGASWQLGWVYCKDAKPEVMVLVDVACWVPKSGERLIVKGYWHSVVGRWARPPGVEWPNYFLLDFYAWRYCRPVLAPPFPDNTTEGTNIIS